MSNLKIEYSIDKIRLKKPVFNKVLENYMKKYAYDPNVNAYEKNNFKQYRYNYEFKSEGGNFWLAFRHNAENENKKKHNLVLEYNPNKVENNNKLKDIMKKFFSDDFLIVSSDVAVDLHNVNMQRDIFYDTSGKRKSLIYTENGTRTIYIGKGLNRVKIYDKAAEQGLNEGINWTRYEVTMKVKEYARRLNMFEYKAKLPNIYMIKEFKYDKELNKTDWCILQGLVNGCYNIGDLGRGKAKKIRSVLEKQTKFKPDNRQLSKVLKEYILNSSLNNIISYENQKSQKNTIKYKLFQKSIKDMMYEKGIIDKKRLNMKIDDIVHERKQISSGNKILDTNI